MKADTTVSEEQAASILRCCKQTTVRRRLINAREAMAILGGISRPTLRALVKRGVLQQINFSSRKARFDYAEVQRFANNGTSAGLTGTADRP